MNTKTLKQVIIDRKIRKGPSSGIDENGAYWETSSDKLDCGGGDGIGQSSSSRSDYLVIRHYRNGEIKALNHRKYWHQNGDRTSNTNLDIMEATSIEEIICEFVAHELEVYWADRLALFLPELPVAPPSPDDDNG